MRRYSGIYAVRAVERSIHLDDPRVWSRRRLRYRHRRGGLRGFRRGASGDLEGLLLAQRRGANLDSLQRGGNELIRVLARRDGADAPDVPSGEANHPAYRGEYREHDQDCHEGFRGFHPCFCTPRPGRRKGAGPGTPLRSKRSSGRLRVLPSPFHPSPWGDMTYEKPSLK